MEENSLSIVSHFYKIINIILNLCFVFIKKKLLVRVAAISLDKSARIQYNAKMN